MISSDYLVHESHIPVRARFPVIDAHNHLWGKWDEIDRVVGVMDEVGVVSYCDVTANVRFEWGGGGYLLSPGNIDDFFTRCARPHPGRFYGFTMAAFAQPADRPLFTDAGEFVERAIALLREDVRKGARGLKILKELGLHHRDGEGNLISCDDRRLAPIWDEAAKLGVPVLIHQADPFGFFEPATPENEHAGSLEKFPAWSFSDRSRFPSFHELQARCKSLLERHPRTSFLLPHVANWPENLGAVARLLEDCPNAHIDFSARCDELGRQPWTAREFLIRFQDRVLFGTDMPASPEMYRFHFRFLETRDEWFIPPDYDGTFGRHRWRVCGLGLPDDALEKIYYRNALELVPKLREETKL